MYRARSTQSTCNPFSDCRSFPHRVFAVRAAFRLTSLENQFVFSRRRYRPLRVQVSSARPWTARRRRRRSLRRRRSRDNARRPCSRKIHPRPRVTTSSIDDRRPEKTSARVCDVDSRRRMIESTALSRFHEVSDLSINCFLSTGRQFVVVNRVEQLDTCPGKRCMNNNKTRCYVVSLAVSALPPIVVSGRARFCFFFSERGAGTRARAIDRSTPTPPQPRPVKSPSCSPRDGGVCTVWSVDTSPWRPRRARQMMI